MPIDFSQWKLQDICTQCEEERRAFRSGNSPSSPACVELFRRAFSDNSDAWSEIYRIFKPLLYSWILNEVQHKKGAFNNNKERDVEIEDFLQDALLAVHRSTTKQFHFDHHDQIGPILDYLQKTALTAVSQWIRKQQAQKRQGFARVSLSDSDETIADPNAGVQIDQINLRSGLTTILESILQTFTDKEKLIYHLKFSCELTPKAMQAEYPDLFDDYDKLEQDIKRIKLRLLKHKELNEFCALRRKAKDSAFLKIVFEDETKTQGVGMDQPCAYDEEILLDYVMGNAQPDIIAAIEASPNCKETARQLAIKMATLETLLYRLHCPASSRMVAYVQRQLPGIERLLFYRHLDQCPLCKEEWQLMNAVQTNLEGKGPVALTQQLWRVIEAIYTPALQIGLMGEWLHYRTPEVFIHISTRQNRSKARSWTVRVQLRTLEGEPITPAVENAIFEETSRPEVNRYQSELPISGNSLIFRDLQSGNYCLSIVMPNEDIVIRNISVGSND